MAKMKAGAEVFSSVEQLRHCFHAGLQQQLQRAGLGSFILACANAFHDKDFLQEHGALLRTGFAHWVTLAEATHRKLTLADEEDLQVWRAIQSIGFPALRLTEYRTLGDWQLQFNLLRSFRPRRLPTQKNMDLYRPFSRAGFSFNKPFMVQEIFWSGALQGRDVDLFYNKYPFMPLHGLLVLERQRCAPQYLTPEDHHYVWELAAMLGESLPGLGFGYNAIGGFASVNHQHFQMFVADNPLPVEAGHWIHQGGERAYPLECQRYMSVDLAWQAIDRLQRSNIAFNALYRAHGLYLFARRKQGQHLVESWSSGFTWYEACGGFLTCCEEEYRMLQAAQLESALGRLREPLPG